MGFNDYLDFDCYEYEEICPSCGRKFLTVQTEQIPGFRDLCDETCPYCKHTLRESMTYEFSTFKIDN